MKSAILHFEPIYTKWDQGIFIYKTLKSVKTEIEEENFKISVYRLPVIKENPGKKAVEKMIAYLKEEKIKKIFFSDSVLMMPEIIKIFSKHFLIYTGQCVINYKIYEILRKYAAERGKNIEESSMVLVTDDPIAAKSVIEKIYRHVKKISIQTKNPSAFSTLIEYYMSEYGLYIPLISVEERKVEDIIVNLSEEIKEKAEFCLENEKREILFYIKKKIRFISQYSKINQNALEFLIEAKYGGISEETIYRFFREYSPKIVKIKNKD